MAVVTKDLGMVTAYAYAVSKGYTGTEEQFATLMASYATVGQQAVDAALEAERQAGLAAGSASDAATAKTAAQSAQSGAESAENGAVLAKTAAESARDTAVSAKNDAVTAKGQAEAQATAAASSASTAETYATNAGASATNAATSAETASTKAEEAAQSAQSVEETAEQLAESLEQIAQNASDIADLQENKAEIDGYYANMTVGNAEQLVATVGVEDSVPYNFRTAGGTADIGDRLTEKIVGGTVAWNQLINVSEKSFTVQANTNETHWLGAGYGGIHIPFVAGHKYLFSWSQNTTMQSNTRNGALYHDGTTHYQNDLTNARLSAGRYSWIFEAQATSAVGNIAIWCHTPDVDVTYQDYVLYDLTKMFGSTIADYIYSLETANAGAGVAWFRKLFPKPYYEYNAGELMSVKAASHITRGFNAWDEEWEVGTLDVNTGANTVSSSNIRSKNYIPIIPNATYYWKAPINNVVCFYDAGKNFISTSYYAVNATIATPTNAHYIRFYTGSAYGTTYKNDICINLSWDGERDGEYAPYEEHVYPLDSDLELRGIPKLDASNNLYYDGDTYESDGTVTRKYGIVDLGTLTWNKTGSDETTFFYASIDCKSLGLFVCPKYSSTNISASTTYEGIALVTNLIRLRDNSFTDYTGSQVATALSGVMLVYELATPTTETADPFQNPQIVEDFGTEEYTDAGVLAEERDVAIPVGHDTMYAANLRAKLEMSPDSPDGDGDYIVRQTNGQNEYVPLVIPAELPANPSADGTYRLKATVSNGVTTLSWEAVT